MFIFYVFLFIGEAILFVLEYWKEILIFIVAGIVLVGIDSYIKKKKQKEEDLWKLY